MANFSTDQLRNIILLSHSGAGKTIVAEAMLSAAGLTTRMGRTEDGTTASDFEPEETRRETSVQTSILATPWKDHKINLIDTPGYADYRGEVVSGIRIADGAVMIVAGPAGVEVGTQQMWQMADRRGLPRLIFVNKMDRENADFARSMTSIVDSFGRRCVPVQYPIGSESSFTGVVDLLRSDGSVPDDLKAQVDEARGRLVEAVAETNDDLTMKYLEGEELTPQELRQGLKEGIAAGQIVPVLVGAATRGIGVEELMSALVDVMPSPAQVPAVEATVPSGGGTVTLGSKAGSPPASLVFKTSADPFVGKLSYLRVYGGVFKSDTHVWNVAKNEDERVGQVFVVRGKTQEAVGELVTGDIGAVAKLASVLTGHTLGDKDNPVVLPGLEFPAPNFFKAVYPTSKADVEKMTSALARIVEEDPSLTLSREPNTLEIILGGLGDTHLDVAVEKMKRKFGVEIRLDTPKVPYKETIRGSARVEYRHKKQTGGHGQFGHVWLELTPLPRGSGFEFAHKVVGGSVPKEYIPSVEKGATKALAEGVVAGYPVVDLKAVLVDGSFHPVDSSGICFEIAGAHALSKGITAADPTLLEPVMLAEITVPDAFTGDVIGDLNSKRGRILGMAPQGDGTTIVEAEVPQAEMLMYATELRSQTQGRGSFTMTFDRLEEVPQHLAQRVVGEIKEREEVRV